MKKIIKISIIFFVVVLFLGLVINFLGKRQLRKLGEIIPSEELSQIQGFSLEQFLESEEPEGFKEFINQEGDFKIKYPADWIVIQGEGLRGELPGTPGTKYDLENLLLAQKFTLEGEFAQLIVSTGAFDVKIDFQQIIEEMKKSNQEQGWEMQIIDLATTKNEVTFEAKYQKPDRYGVHSQEKIIFLQSQDDKKRGYLVALITFDRDWQKFEQEAKEILDSIEIKI